MKILIIDNYDSFTYNLVQYIRAIENTEITVVRNDKIPLEAIAAYDAIVLSPGPGLPKDAGLLLDIIKTYYKSKPILGVCLGHQAIAECFGGTLRNLTKVYHGIATPISIKKSHTIFENIEKTLSYHLQNIMLNLCIHYTL